MIGRAAGGHLRFQWYPRSPLDAAVILTDGRTVGLLRQGPTDDKTGFSKRVWWLLEESYFDLVPDAVRLRHAQRLLARSRDAVLVTEEINATQAGEEDASGTSGASPGR